MKRVGTGLYGCIHDRAGGVTVFGGVVIRFDTELLQGVDRGLDHHRRAVLLIDDLCVIVDAVQHEVIELCSHAVCDKRAACSGAIARLRLHDAHGKFGELEEIATVEREVIDGLGGDHLSHGGAFAFEQGG